MDKMDEQIMVVRREELFLGDEFQGFMPEGRVDYELRIISKGFYHKRGLAESDRALKQPIPYGIIVNPKQRTVFCYQRALKGQGYSEKRLEGRLSIGVGGHVEMVDAENPMRSGLLREISEEVDVPSNFKLGKLGFINHETDVHAFHFGVLYLIETDSMEVRLRGEEAMEGRMVGLGELQALISSGRFEVELWTTLSVQPLLDYFSKVK